MGVYDIEELAGGGKRARVANPRSCTMCRECIREDHMNEKIALRRVRNHFICMTHLHSHSIPSAPLHSILIGICWCLITVSIETEGSGPPTPAAIFKESVGVLMKKCRAVLAELDTASKAQAAKSKRRPGSAVEEADDAEEPLADDAVDETED
jgi:hypothetical protein